MNGAELIQRWESAFGTAAETLQHTAQGLAASEAADLTVSAGFSSDIITGLRQELLELYRITPNGQRVILPDYLAMEQLRSNNDLPLDVSLFPAVTMNMTLSGATLNADGCITNLQLERSEIATLEGIQDLIELKHLSLSTNEIADLSPIAKLPRLEGLGLSYNRISDLSPLSGMQHLVELYADHNPITNLSGLSDLPKLRLLALSGDHTLDITPLQSFPALAVLSLSASTQDSNGTSIDLSPLLQFPAITRVMLSPIPNTASAVQVMEELRHRGVAI